MMSYVVKYFNIFLWGSIFYTFALILQLQAQAQAQSLSDSMKNKAGIDQTLLPSPEQVDVILQSVNRNDPRPIQPELTFAVPGDTIDWVLRIKNNSQQILRHLHIEFEDPRNIVPDTWSGTGNMTIPKISEYIQNLGNLRPGELSRTFAVQEVSQTCQQYQPTAIISWGSVADTSDPGRIQKKVQTTFETGLSEAQLQLNQTIRPSEAGASIVQSSAIITATMKNTGVDLGHLQIEANLSEAFIYDETMPPKWRGDNEDDIKITVDNSNTRKPKFKVESRTLNSVALAQYARAALEFYVKRTENYAVDTISNSLTTTLFDMCGTSLTLPENRAETTVGMPELALVVEGPVTAGVSPQDKQQRVFDFILTNKGSTPALSPQVRLSIGTGWLATLPQGCLLSAPGEIICSLPDDNLPAGELYKIPLVVHPSPVEGDLSIHAQTETYARDGKGYFTSTVLSKAQTRIEPPGFFVNIVRVDADGTEIENNEGIKNKDTFFVDLNATWFSLVNRTVSNTSIQIDLPPQLTLLSSKIITTDDISIDSASQPTSGYGGSIVWNLKDFDKAGKLSVRLKFQVNAVLEQQEQEIEYAVLNAISQFRIGNAFYRIQGASAENVRDPAHLVIPIIQPNINVNLSLKKDQPIVVSAGEKTFIDFEINNTGFASADINRLRLTLPEYVSLDVPFDSMQDSLLGLQDVKYVERDTDTHVVEVTRANLDGMRITNLDDNTDQVITRNQLKPQYQLKWRMPIKIDDDVPPDYKLLFRGSVSYLNAEGKTQEVIKDYDATTPSIKAFIERTENKNDKVRHNGELAYKITTNLPRGHVNDLDLLVQLPPSFVLSTQQPYTYTVGEQAVCSNVQTPVLQSNDQNNERHILWKLGDCHISLVQEVPLTLVFKGKVQDADSSMNKRDIEAWRKLSFTGQAKYTYAQAENIKVQNIKLVQDNRQITGPLIHLSMSPNILSMVDAADNVILKGIFENKGNEVFKRFQVQLVNKNADIHVFDCKNSTILVQGENKTTVHDDSKENCGNTIVQSIPIDLKSDTSMPFKINVELLQGLEIGTKATYELRILRDKNIVKNISVKPVQTIVSTRDVAEPLSSVENIYQGEKNSILIGAPFKLKTVFSFPEGKINNLDLGVELELEDYADTTKSVDVPFELSAATLQRSTSDLQSSADPANINQSSVDASVDIRSVVNVEKTETGLRAVLPLGTVETLNNKTDFRRLRYTFLLTFTPIDSTAFVQGHRVASRSFLRAGDKKEERATTRSKTIAYIAEPYVEVATTIDDPDGLVHQNEKQPFRVNVCNRGTAPAYGLRLDILLDPDLRYLDTAASTLRTTKGESIGVVSYDNTRRTIDVQTDWGRALKEGECFQAEFTAVMKSSTQDQIGVTVNNIYYSSQSDGQSKHNKVYTIPAATFRVPTTKFYGEAPEQIQYDSNNIETIDIPFTLFLPVKSGASVLNTTLDSQPQTGLQLSAQSSLGLEWLFIKDVNQNARIDPGEPVWDARSEKLYNDDQSGNTVSFVARTQLSQSYKKREWTDTTQIRASLLTQSSQSGSTFMQTVSTSTPGAVAPLEIMRLMALDRNCNNTLEDETAQDALFEISKAAQVGECLRIQLLFSNTLRQVRENINIKDAIPAETAYVKESAAYIFVPRGLENKPVYFDVARNVLNWNLQGTLLPDQQGIVEYTVQVNDK